MISKKVIDKYKLDTASLKAIFTADEKSEKVKKLITLLADRAREGRERNLRDYRPYAAIDLAYEEALDNQVPVILRHILAGKGTEAETLQALRTWGLNEECLFCKIEEAGTIKWIPNFPYFFQFTLPLVRAYLTIRHAKLFNERNTVPLLPYMPFRNTSEDRIHCEILTDYVEKVSTNFGYPSTLRDWIFNALMYSVSLKFPVESWTEIETEDESGEGTIEKEGIRYVVPHVTRIFYDMMYPLHTLNTGTGCSYAGYWDVVRWGEVESNPAYWNKEKVPYGYNWMDPTQRWANYFQEAYPCVLKFPDVPAGVSKTSDRVKMAQFYTRNDYDKAFFVTYMFAELVPSEWGLGNYNKKVWMKFTMGGDDVIMFAETWRYRPVDYIGYDADSGRGRNVSLAQEIQPFQEQSSNVLTAYILSIKRNLANIVFYNTEAVDASKITQIERRSQSQYSQLIFVGFDGMKMERAGVEMSNIFQNVKFPYANTTEILQALNTIIALLERTIVISSQEIGAAASHQQGNKEIEVIAESSNNRVAYTGSFIDQGRDAWRRQIAEAALQHSSVEEIESQVSTDIPDLETHLKEMGFEFKSGTPKDGQRKVIIKGPIKNVKIVQFLSRRGEEDRRADMATAQSIMVAVSAIANNQLLSTVVDPESLIDLIEFAAKLSGADADFKIKTNREAVTSVQLQQSIEAIKTAIMQEVEKNISQPVAGEIAKDQQEIEGLKKNVSDIIGLLEKIKQAAMPGVIPPNGNPEIQPIASQAGPIPQVA